MVWPVAATTVPVTMLPGVAVALTIAVVNWGVLPAT
jgi:hypothetical protein